MGFSGDLKPARVTFSRAMNQSFNSLPPLVGYITHYCCCYLEFIYEYYCSTEWQHPSPHISKHIKCSLYIPWTVTWSVVKSCLSSCLKNMVLWFCIANQAVIDSALIQWCLALSIWQYFLCLHWGPYSGSAKLCRPATLPLHPPQRSQHTGYSGEEGTDKSLNTESDGSEWHSRTGPGSMCQSAGCHLHGHLQPLHGTDYHPKLLQHP